MAQKYGKWENVKSLGGGGQGDIFLVRDPSRPGEKFALKRLRRSDRRDLFEREIRAVRALNHPNILRIIDFDLSSNTPYYVAEYCERGSLVDVGANAFKGDVPKTASTLLPILDALGAAHKVGVYHRDLKPPNILVRATGEPVIADFGICHMEGDERVTLTDEAMGSVNYIAPEMESGRRLGPPRAETDGYSFGKVLYWMLSGGRIFAREGHRTLALTEVLGEQRFEHVHSLLDALLVENPSDRMKFTDLPGRLKQTEMLAMGAFAPLKPSLGIQCRFCGLGKYEKLFGPDDNWRGIRFVGGAGFTTGTDPRALRCSHCGHIELFDFRGVAENWWAK
jgi:serine/threonine protein kinase